MEYSYKSIHQDGLDGFEEKKSKFISYARPVKSEAEAESFIGEVKEKNKEASHNCYGYIIDDNIKRFSDDGEPSHTAGMPILSTLEAKGLKEVAVVVTRYFGGTLLGKGGLVKAYTRGCQMALAKAIEVDKVLHEKAKISFAYEFIGQLDNYLITNNISVIDKLYTDDVSYLLYIEKEKRPNIYQDIQDITGGQVKFEEIEDLYLSMKNGKLVR